MLKLSETYIKNIKAVHKEKGEQWLKQLPELISNCEERWGLKVTEPFELSFNFVAAAILSENGGQVVLKLSIPSKDFLNELEALKLFHQHNRNIVKLIDYDEEKGIILLERLQPGQMLATLEDDEQATRIAANVLKDFWIPAPPNTKLPTTRNREESLIKIRKNNPHAIGPIPGVWLEEAETVFKEAHLTGTREYLLHGDLHHYNILTHGDSWMVIDPQGLIGEREYDLIQFLLNKLPKEHVLEVIEKRIEIFVDELGLNKERILIWGVAHSVLSTAWSVEDGDYSESFYKGIGTFRELYKRWQEKKVGS
ncbi:aminoglycoside phosphotransferase family protein [Pseudoneobacillus sp. C159]